MNEGGHSGRRRIALAAITALACGMGAAAGAPASAAARTMPHVEIGIPGEDLGTQRDAGAVEVRHTGGAVKQLQAPDHQAGDKFGTATIAFDVDRDNRQDLFVGAPGKDVGGKADAGAIYVFHGTASGFVHWTTLTMDSLSVEGGSQAGAGFGSSLSRDWRQGDNPTYKWFAAGAPTYDVDGAADAGAAVEIGIGQGAQPSFGGRLWTAADWPGTTPRAGDRFGAAIAEMDSMRAVGAPGRDVSGQADAGEVFFVTLLADGIQSTVTQDTPGVPGAAEAGDQFGAALTMNWHRLYVGIPGEDIGTAADAGMVQAMNLQGWENPPAGGPGFSQNSADDVTGKPLAGAAEAGDRFGAALGWYSEQGAASDAASYILLGAPGEDMGSARDAGMVNVLHDPAIDAYSDSRLGGTNEAGDRFGAALYGRDAELATAAIGIPGENGGSGVVKPVFPVRTTWWQAGDPREAGDGYGSFVEGSL
ncbi:integrin alpha [Flindersiella endophytica]